MQCNRWWQQFTTSSDLNNSIENVTTLVDLNVPDSSSIAAVERASAPAYDFAAAHGGPPRPSEQHSALRQGLQSAMRWFGRCTKAGTSKNTVWLLTNDDSPDEADPSEQARSERIAHDMHEEGLDLHLFHIPRAATHRKFEPRRFFSRLLLPPVEGDGAAAASSSSASDADLRAKAECCRHGLG